MQVYEADEITMTEETVLCRYNAVLSVCVKILPLKPTAEGENWRQMGLQEEV